MATTSPARIDDDLYASAKLAGVIESRSASQQVIHWARIGRELEASASISHRDIGEVLAGSRSYDLLGTKEQAIVRAQWSARMDTLREALNLSKQFAAYGRAWVELDDDGNIVEGGDVTGDSIGTEGRQDVEHEQASERGSTDRGSNVKHSRTGGDGARSAKGTETGRRAKASGLGVRTRAPG